MPLIKADSDLKDLYTIRLLNVGAEVPLQTPPRITSDSRSASFKETSMRTREPVAIFEGSNSRTLDIEFTYIVGFAGWTPSTVTGALQTLRNYFHSGIGKVENLAVATMVLASHGEQTPMTMRVHDVSIKHGTCYILTNGTAMPLRTDVTMQAKVWTKSVGKDDEPKQDVKNLTEHPFGLWI